MRHLDVVKQNTIRFVCGRRTKWLIVILWLVVLVIAAPLGAKLNDAQDNDAQSWLPGSAESTQVLDISEVFRPEQIPAVVVYNAFARSVGGYRQLLGDAIALVMRLVSRECEEPANTHFRAAE